MGELEWLWVGNNRLDYLDGIEGAKRLRTLGVSNNVYIEDLSPLAELESLEELWFSNNSVSDLRPLAALSSLRRIEGNDNLLKTLAGLEDMQYLREVYLPDNDISDVSALKGAPIAGLNLERNKVQKFA